MDMWDDDPEYEERERRDALKGKQFVALGTPLEHPYPRIRSVLTEGLTQDVTRDLNSQLRSLGFDELDEEQRAETRGHMERTIRGVIEDALHPDSDIHTDAINAIHTHLKRYRNRR